eukprot:COSAG05_NODE_2895_length_2530_cov_2.067873_2_plen_48_part_00
MLGEIVEFFRSGVAPVPMAETLEIYAFMYLPAEISEPYSHVGHRLSL